MPRSILTNPTSAPGDPRVIDLAPAMGVSKPPASKRGVVLGLILAFAIPISSWALATLVEHA